jgi:hypothetical protein
MPESPHPQGQSRDQRLQRTENARREARFRFARDRIDKIASGNPPLTPEQRAELARRILAGDAA